jgi:pimeloyl-ACP methyl ester carboxylesterase
LPRAHLSRSLLERVFRHPSRFTEASREHYAKLYALPGAMHSGFAQFAAFDQDALDNQEFIATKGKLAMPVLAIGGEKSFGPMMATIMRFAASNVTEGMVSDSGHWIMVENPKATIAIVSDFPHFQVNEPVTQSDLGRSSYVASWP